MDFTYQSASGAIQGHHGPLVNFLKPKVKNIYRTIWKYEQGNGNELRNSFANFNWDSLKDSDINIYAENVSDAISEYALKFIPNKKSSLIHKNLSG